MDPSSLDSQQAASTDQFDRQAANYGRKHTVLADTSDVAALLDPVEIKSGAKALDVATGGGHTGLYLARRGCAVTLGDLSEKMLEAACGLLAEEGFSVETARFPAENMPFPDASFDLVTVRIAPHHFSSPREFVLEAARVLKPGGVFMLIDGSVPDDAPVAAEWLNQVEKWRDPSHGRLLSRAAWTELVKEAGLTINAAELHTKKQPDLFWYFETAATNPENRARVLEAVRTAPEEVTRTLSLAEEDGKITWQWPILHLLARKEA